MRTGPSCRLSKIRANLLKLAPFGLAPFLGVDAVLSDARLTGTHGAHGDEEAQAACDVKAMEVVFPPMLGLSKERQYGDRTE